jgi:hypothetical protein
MTITGTPTLIADSTVDVTLPLANPRETEATVIRQYVFARSASDVRRDVRCFRTSANTHEKTASKGLA